MTKLQDSFNKAKFAKAKQKFKSFEKSILKSIGAIEEFLSVEDFREYCDQAYSLIAMQRASMVKFKRGLSAEELPFLLNTDNTENNEPYFIVHKKDKSMFEWEKVFTFTCPLDCLTQVIPEVDEGFRIPCFPEYHTAVVKEVEIREYNLLNGINTPTLISFSTLRSEYLWVFKNYKDYE